MQKTATVFFITSVFIGSTHCQHKNDDYSLSVEKVEKKNSPSGIEVRPIGTHNKNVAFVHKDMNEIFHFYMYNEITNSFISDSIIIDQKKHKLVRVKRYEELLLAMGYFDVPKEFTDVPVSQIPIDAHTYQDLWIRKGHSEYKVDSLPYHFIDKFYNCKLSSDLRFLVCNPFTSVSPSYIPNEDGIVILYDLKEIEKNHVKKQVLNCNNCLNTFIYGDTLIFQKEIPIGKGFDGDYHNIYKAPRTNINDTILLARNIELQLISPDKKYILGTQYLYGKNCPLILDLTSGRFQYILGRDYPLDRSFYSMLKNQFAFDFGTHIVYIECPRVFPFEAKKNYSRYTKIEDDDKFWKRFSHSPLHN